MTSSQSSWRSHLGERTSGTSRGKGSGSPSGFLELLMTRHSRGPSSHLPGSTGPRTSTSRSDAGARSVAPGQPKLDGASASRRNVVTPSSEELRSRDFRSSRRKPARTPLRPELIDEARGAAATGSLSEEEFLDLFTETFPGATWLDGGRDDRPTAPPEELHPHDYVVVGGGKYNLEELERWLSELRSEPRILTGTGRGAEAKLRELRPNAQAAELRSELYGARAGTCQVEALVGTALAGTTLVLVGTGSRVAEARSVLRRFPASVLPPLVELP